MPPIIRQQHWTEESLLAAGFQHYERIKQLVLARQLPESEAPLRIPTSRGDTLIAHEGYMIVYMAEGERKAHPEDYHHWPVEPAIFRKTYLAWQGDWYPSAAQKHLLDYGCKPYYKASGIWAKVLKEDTYIQSIEHPEPIIVAAGDLLAIGEDGEPYHMGEQTFAARYRRGMDEATPFKKAVTRLLNFFKNS